MKYGVVIDKDAIILQKMYGNVAKITRTETLIRRGHFVLCPFLNYKVQGKVKRLKALTAKYTNSEQRLWGSFKRSGSLAKEGTKTP